MKKIPLTRGLFALVDDQDFEALSKFSWHAAKRGQRFYAARREGWKGPVFYMHREIAGGPEGLDVAHDDGDGLNNQRHNLEPKTRARNLRGFCRKIEGATSKFRGVCWDESAGRWKAQIKFEDRNKFLGRFSLEVVAARAYDEFALKHFGTDAQLNNV